MKLTDTNRSIGLIVPIPYIHSEIKKSNKIKQNKKSKQKTSSHIFDMFLADLVVMAERLHPIPIPNSAVKRSSADGTVS